MRTRRPTTWMPLAAILTAFCSAPAAHGEPTGPPSASSPQICPSGSCSVPIAVLPTPTTSCQTTSLTLTCANPATYSIDLQGGQNYTFTLCGATCPGANATFDSRLDLYQGATLVASDTNACGSNGEIVYTTNPLTGTGTYCITVVPEVGFGNFTLGWFVTCQAPSNLVVGPANAGITTQTCTKDVTFSVNSAGTGDFTYSWTIAPVLPNTAVPATRTITRSQNGDQFTSTLTGLGFYQVTIDVSNGCGNQTEVLNFELRDAAGPDIACTAATVPCQAPPPPDPVIASPTRVRSAAGGGSVSGDGSTGRLAGVEPPAAAPGDATQERAGSGTGTTSAALASRAFSSEVASRLAANRDEVSRLLLAAPTAEQARMLIARKLDLIASDVEVNESTDPGYFRPPGRSAVSCPTPCTVGSLTATHPFYDVFLGCGNGAFTARTGLSHSVTTSSGAQQNVIFGGANASPGTSDITLHLFNNNQNYLSPTGGQACGFDPPDTSVEPNSIGIEQEWTIDPLFAGLSPLTLRQEIVAFGSIEPNSGVRLTLGVQNPVSSSVPAQVGFRWQVDQQNSFDDGPGFATVLCSPFTIGPERFAEHEFLPSEIQDFYRLQNNTGSPIFSNFTSTAAISGFPDTGTPDRLIYGTWPSLRSSVWNYAANEGANADFDSATLLYYGYTAANALNVPPGGAISRSVVIFTAGQQQSCGDFIPGTGTGTSLEVCPGDCVQLGATATDNCSTSSVRVTGSSAGAPACSGNPCTVSFPTSGTYTYSWQATDTAGNNTSCETRINVATPPVAALAPLADLCEGDSLTLDASATAPNGCTAVEYQFSGPSGVLVPWGSAATYGPFVPPASGTYTVETRCQAQAACVTATSRSVAVTAKPVPRAPQPPAACEGSTVVFDAGGSAPSGCAMPLEYQWSDGTGVVQPWSTRPTLSVAPAPGATYTVEVRCPTNTTCVASLGVQADMVPFPLPVATGPSSVCAGTPLTVDASGSSANGCPVPLEYQLRNGAAVLVPWTTAPMLGPVSPATTTSYTVDVRCPAATPACVASTGVPVTAVPIPVAVASPDQSVCVAAPVRLDGSASTAPGCALGPLYEWRQGATVVRPASPVATWAPPTAVAGTTTYTLVVSCASLTSCLSTDTVDVTVRVCPMFVRFETYDARVATGGGVEVAWRTLSEEDTNFFVVERAASSAASFAAVGAPVSAVGPGFNYRLVDTTAAPGTFPRYRIVEYTSNGRGDESPVFQAH